MVADKLNEIGGSVEAHGVSGDPVEEEHQAWHDRRSLAGRLDNTHARKKIY
jgi:hypothetical protein